MTNLTEKSGRSQESGRPESLQDLHVPLAGWGRGIPRASGSPGKDLNSRLECRSQLIPIKGHGGDGSQRGPRKVLLERLRAEVSSSVRASTFLITEAEGGQGRSGVLCCLFVGADGSTAPDL